ncbi:metal-sensitive transcriptional regulator [Clostridioides mangenotii]|uniref:metal-sensitive transcriptional regulator n=1 Tax=Metaclostridioides mangenotii TaxID=1540 RepID=UPI001C108E1B|nr:MULTISPECIES: metal-sensitive transcriptional regulator [Clostridioides]MBS5788544.1 metal-sensitive transcriptional regulator [Clostridioides difficile]MBU5306818.1 metal-sensitive transcriptional regulator [Clostridioides mangenotii]MCR1953614.1 metal-sensitive transcriptional regulator [Clostridioides mangenotii]
MEEKKLSQVNNKDALSKRLKKIEGQVKGIQKMVEDERYCVDILVQISAVRSAINKVGTILLENHIKGCVTESIKHDDYLETDNTIEELMDTINKFTK